MTSRWVQGPEFLYDNTPSGQVQIPDELCSEVRKEVFSFHTTVGEEKFSERFLRYSEWDRLLRAVANLKLVVYNMRNPDNQKSFSGQELIDAESLVFKLIQQDYLAECDL